MAREVRHRPRRAAGGGAVSLLSRIHANRCAVVDCQRERLPDAQVCKDDLGELWANRLDRQPDGSYRRRRAFPARDLTGSVRVA